MATTVARLEAVLSADTKQFDRAMGRSESTMGKVSKAAGIAGLAIAGALGVAAKIGFDELKQGQLVAAQTNAVLQSTGAVANVTAGQIDTMANAMLRKTGIDDETIKSGENMLLTFTNIRNEVGKGNDIFNQSTSILADMSTALGTDMSKQAIQLGKALNDPVKGMSALRRVGVAFTDAQKTQVEQMVKTGNTIGAQKLILAELNKEFGGSAEAAGKTLPGQLNIAKETFANLSGEIVSSLLPAFNMLVGWLSKATSWMSEHERATKIIVAVLGGLAATLLTVSAAMKIVAAGQAIVTAAQWAFNVALTANPIGIIILALVALGAALVVLWLKSETFRDIVTGVWNTIKTVVQSVVGYFTNTALPAIQGFIDNVRGVFNSVKDWLENNWKAALIVILGGIPGAIWVAFHSKFGDEFLEKVKDAFRAVKDWIKEKIVDVIVGFFEDIPGRIAGAVKGVVGAVTSKVGSLVGKVNPFGDAASPQFSPFADSSISPALWDELGAGRGMGLVMSSGYRPGAVTKHGTPSDHGVFPSKAIDMAGSSSAMAAFFRSLIGDRGVKQAFYDPLGSIFGGVLSTYREGGHSDHVHVATYDKGGFLRPGWNLAYNGLGRPEPVGGAAGNTYVTVNAPGLIGHKDELARAIADLLTQHKKSGGYLGFAT